MYSNKTVSVIIPIYNCEKFINKTINSVLEQTYTDVEIILIDDCSKDSSYNIVKDYCNRIPDKISIFKFTKNSGVAVARNKGLELSKGRYVAFLDSDDLWKRTKLEEELTLLGEKNGSFCFSSIEMIDENDNLIKTKRDVREEVDYKYLLKNTMIPTSSVLIDREKVGAFQMPLLRSGQDYATWLLLLRSINKAYGINKALVQYRVRKNSLSSGKLKSISQVYNIQTGQEKISKIRASFNTFCFIFNALKKYYF